MGAVDHLVSLLFVLHDVLGVVSSVLISFFDFFETSQKLLVGFTLLLLLGLLILRLWLVQLDRRFASHLLNFIDFTLHSSFNGIYMFIIKTLVQCILKIFVF